MGADETQCWIRAPEECLDVGEKPVVRGESPDEDDVLEIKSRLSALYPGSHSKSSYHNFLVRATALFEYRTLDSGGRWFEKFSDVRT